MGRLIEQQAVIDCLTNTAKYFDMPQADKWTKGIHYGLIHGLDNILDNVPTIEAIPKDQYEARLKADLKAILVELQLEVEEIKPLKPTDDEDWQYGCFHGLTLMQNKCLKLIQQKIDKLKEDNDV